MKHLYSKEYYQNIIDGSYKSAEIVLGLLFKSFQPTSIIDIGCGQGAWLSVAKKLGTIELKGIDGTWVDQNKLLSKNIDFLEADFEKQFPKLDKKYDLAISLEVAEHLNKKLSNNFVEFLTMSSDVVLFSAAIKHQGGNNHINEQWQSYWIDKFSKREYICFDIIRPTIWNNEDIEWWYRQNTFLFVKDHSNILNINELKKLEKPIYDIAHPSCYECKVIQ